MTKAIVTVEKGTDGNYWCSTEIGNGGYNGCGLTVEEAKKDLEVCLEEARQAGDLQGDIALEYKYDLQSFFNYFDYFNVNEVARRGWHQSIAAVQQWMQESGRKDLQTAFRMLQQHQERFTGRIFLIRLFHNNELFEPPARDVWEAFSNDS